MPKESVNKARNDEIKVSVFREMEIHFPGDVYILAVWIAMSDRAKSTPAGHRQTTLQGLAAIFSSAYGIDYSRPLSAQDVMARFRDHGIKGNPLLRLDDDIYATNAEFRHLNGR